MKYSIDIKNCFFQRRESKVVREGQNFNEKKIVGEKAADFIKNGW
jgi:hypothetical protein